MVVHGDLQCPSQPRNATYLGHSPTPENASGGLGGSWPHPGMLARGARLQRRSLGLKLRLAATTMASGHLVHHFFFLLEKLYCTYTHIIYICVCVCIGKLVPLHDVSPSSYPQ
jgi:hypothetical protein